MGWRCAFEDMAIGRPWLEQVGCEPVSGSGERCDVILRAPTRLVYRLQLRAVVLAMHSTSEAFVASYCVCGTLGVSGLAF